MSNVSKAIAGAIATAAAASGTAYVVIPEGVEVPWWGYLAVPIINALIGYLIVYAAPKNVP